MPKIIETKNVDRLCFLITDLDVLTYLHELVEYDTDGHVINRPDIENARQNAASYLLEKQSKTVFQIKRIIEQEDFCQVFRDR